MALILLDTVYDLILLNTLYDLILLNTLYDLILLNTPHWLMLKYRVCSCDSSIVQCYHILDIVNF